MNEEKNIKDFSDVELKAILWDLEQQMKPLQNNYLIVAKELQGRYTQLNKGNQTMEEEQKFQTVEHTTEDEDSEDELDEELSEEDEE